MIAQMIRQQTDEMFTAEYTKAIWECRRLRDACRAACKTDRVTARKISLEFGRAKEWATALGNDIGRHAHIDIYSDGK